MQCSAVQCNAVQCSAMQCNAVLRTLWWNWKTIFKDPNAITFHSKNYGALYYTERIALYYYSALHYTALYFTALL